MTKKPSFSVDICATCITSKAPPLPLREELPSLGFEIVYNAGGLGAKASKHETKIALDQYRKQCQTKELKKRRFFPKSSRRIRETLLERKKIEHQLKIPHALSYAAYEHRLARLEEKSWTSTSTSFTPTTHASSHKSISLYKYKDGKKPFTKRCKGRWGISLRRRIGSNRKKDTKSLPSETSEFLQTSSIRDTIGKAAFGDFLVPVNSSSHEKENGVDCGMYTKRNPLKWKRAFDSESFDSHSNDSSISSNGDCSTNDIKLQFVASDEMEKKLPGFNTFNETEREGAAFANQGMNKDVSLIMAAGDSAKSSAKLYDDLEVEEAIAAAFKEFANPKLNSASISPIAAQSSNNPFNIHEAPAPWSGSTKYAIENQSAEAYGISSKVEPQRPMEREPIRDRDKSHIKQQNWFWFAKHLFEDVAGDVVKASITSTPGFKIEAKSLEVADEPVVVEERRAEVKKSIAHLPAVTLSIKTKAGSEGLGDSGGPNQCNTRLPFLEMLTGLGSCMSDILGAVQETPELAHVKCQDDGRFPLHTLCNRDIIDRSSVAEAPLAGVLLADILEYKEVLRNLLEAYPAAATVMDKTGDLPVHLLARTLMKWEAYWYTTVYAQAAKVFNPDGKDANAISSLYHTMSTCVELVLEPLVTKEDLCRQPGSVGRMFPLHIASIFTCSVESLQSLLEAYPNAAKKRCDLNTLNTFTPDDSFPLILHDSLSTDFPKWEVEIFKQNESYVAGLGCHKYGDDTERYLRRSDLHFAYNPTIEPYRLDGERIRRLERKIIFEAIQVVEGKEDCLSKAMQRIWVWLCTFKEHGSKRPTYSQSVKRIARMLTLRAVQYLASISTPHGKLVLDEATPECSRVIQLRLAESQPIDLWGKRVPQSRRLTKQNVGQFVKKIFNVEQQRFPTSFIVLPYRLQVNKDGFNSIGTPEAIEVADLFTSYMLRLTDPRALLHYLNVKSQKHYGEPLIQGSKTDEARQNFLDSIKRVEDNMLSLYKPGSSFLYLLDEGTGFPVVPGSTDEYPIILAEPMSIIPKIFPLMMPGLVMMRGEQSLITLSKVLLDSDVTMVPRNWLTTTDNIERRLLSAEVADLTDSEASTLGDRISQLSSSNKTRWEGIMSPKNGNTEWAAEMSILNTLMEVNDPSMKFAGLKVQRDDDSSLFWSVDSNNDCCNSTLALGALHIDDLSNKQKELAKKLERMRVDRKDSGPDFRYPRKNFVEPHNEMLNKPFWQRLANACDYVKYPDKAVDSERKKLPLKIAIDCKSKLDSEISSDDMNGEIRKKYSFLLSDLAVKDRDNKGQEAFCCRQRERGSSSERIWEDVTSELDRAGMFYEESAILHLKVGIAEEAKRSGLLAKRIASLQEGGAHVCFKAEALDTELPYHEIQNEVTVLPGLSDSRKLLIRLFDLEDRLLCDEIDIQHLAIESLSMFYQIEEVDPDNLFEETKEEFNSRESVLHRAHPRVDSASFRADARGFCGEKTPSLAMSLSNDPGSFVNPLDLTNLNDNVMEDIAVPWVVYHESTGQIEF